MSGEGNQKVAYVCGPLTELPADIIESVKLFYQRIAQACQVVTGLRAFVPHEHCDPIEHAALTPPEVDMKERGQIRDNTSFLIVVPLAPSWGGGIEVEMANEYGVPILVVCEREKLHQKRISRLLLGNPGVKAILEYGIQDEALRKIRKTLEIFTTPHQ